MIREEKKKIEEGVKQSAVDHLNAKSSEEALSHFTRDVIAVSNDQLFNSFETLAEDVKEYYKILKEVNHASWSDIHIKILNQNAATFTAKFKYTFTSIDDEITNLQGVWTALFVNENGIWKIRLRHESFVVL